MFSPIRKIKERNYEKGADTLGGDENAGSS